MEILQPLILIFKGNFPDVYFFVRAQLMLVFEAGPAFMLVGGAILLLEKLRPAVPGQAIFSKGLINDFLWFWATATFVLAVIDPMAVFLKNHVFQAYLSDLSLDFVLHAPIALQVVLALLIGDFLAWFHHYVRHKVPLMWQFHAVHHSATEMNFMTNSRVHPIDRVFPLLIVFIPAGILLPAGVATIGAVAWYFLVTWYQRFYHANVRVNFGPLKYVLVSPQSHRVHHSVLPEHRDCNFGVLFCVWDRLFRTHIDIPDNVYPPTGIPDPGFPMEKTFRPQDVLMTFVNQWLYPMLSAGRLLLGRERHPEIDRSSESQGAQPFVKP